MLEKGAGALSPQQLGPAGLETVNSTGSLMSCVPLLGPLNYNSTQGPSQCCPAVELSFFNGFELMEALHKKPSTSQGCHFHQLTVKKYIWLKAKPDYQT